MTLLEECIEALGERANTYTNEKSLEFFDNFQKEIPFSSWGQINWESISKKKKIQNIKEISDTLKPTECYILWDEASLPVVKTHLSDILSAIDDVTAVSFDTWIYSKTEKWVIEFFHEGQITLGFL